MLDAGGKQWCREASPAPFHQPYLAHLCLPGLCGGPPPISVLAPDHAAGYRTTNTREATCGRSAPATPAASPRAWRSPVGDFAAPELGTTPNRERFLHGGLPWEVRNKNTSQARSGRSERASPLALLNANGMAATAFPCGSGPIYGGGGIRTLDTPKRRITVFERIGPREVDSLNKPAVNLLG